MGLSQGFATGLRHPDITEFPFLDQFVEGLGRFLDRNLGIDSSTFEKIQLLGTSEMFVDVIDATPQALLAANSLNYNPEEAKG